MKKRLFLIFCGVMCLFFVLCSCGDDSEGSDLLTNSGNQTSSSIPIIPDGGNVDDDEQVVFPPETDCPANELGHYWKNVTIDKKTSSSGSVILRGTCFNCGDSLGKEVITLVDHDGWKRALSSDGLNSFTMIVNNEYTDFDENGSLAWRIINNNYTQDLFVNSEKNSSNHAIKFSGFLLAESYNKFTYDQTTKTYVYKDDNTRIELGFADGTLLLHSVSSLVQESPVTTSVYVNHGRIKIEAPKYLTDSFSKAASLDALSKSTLTDSQAEKLFEVLSSLSFDSSFEASYLENGQVSVYFILENEKIDPFFDLKYSTVSVSMTDDKITSVSFDGNKVELSY